MFLTKGWKVFVGELEEEIKILQANAYTDCPTNDEWQIRRGVIARLTQLIGFEEFIRAVVEQKESEDVEV